MLVECRYMNRLRGIRCLLLLLKESECGLWHHVLPIEVFCRRILYVCRSRVSHCLVLQKDMLMNRRKLVLLLV